MRRALLYLILAIISSSCALLPSRNVRLDPRTEFPEVRPFDGSRNLPGEAPVSTADLEGAWLFRQPVAGPGRDPIFGNSPPLFNALWLWFREDGTYDLVYQAYWGARARNDPRLSGIDVRESGRFLLAGGNLSFEPEATRALEIRPGNRQRSAPGNEPRTYLARVDGGYLNLAGPCATYQVESVCRESANVWVSLRSVSIGSPDDVPEL